MVRLYCLENGLIQFDTSVYVPSLPRGTRRWGPIPTFLIQHSQGLVLVDTGCHPKVAEDPKYWGDLSRAMVPAVSQEHLAHNALKAAGFNPESVDIVVNTHLHMDHAGGNQLFPHATFLVQQREWEFAATQEGRGYFRNDWGHSLNYRQLEDEVYDVFGDGVVVLRRTGGHTPGHQVVEINLASGKIILCADVIPMRENLQGEVPRNSIDADETRSTAAWVLGRMALGAKVVFGHDGREWESVRKAPNYYE